MPTFHLRNPQDTRHVRHPDRGSHNIRGSSQRPKSTCSSSNYSLQSHLFSQLASGCLYIGRKVFRSWHLRCSFLRRVQPLMEKLWLGSILEDFRWLAFSFVNCESLNKKSTYYFKLKDHTKYFWDCLRLEGLYSLSLCATRTPTWPRGPGTRFSPLSLYYLFFFFLPDYQTTWTRYSLPSLTFCSYVFSPSGAWYEVVHASPPCNPV